MTFVLLDGINIRSAEYELVPKTHIDVPLEENVLLEIYMNAELLLNFANKADSFYKNQ